MKEGIGEEKESSGGGVGLGIGLGGDMIAVSHMA